MHFCRDFLIKTNPSKLLELFKKQAKNSKELNFDQFVQLLNRLATEDSIDSAQYQINLGLDNWKICQSKMKTLQRPFQMTDQTERIKDIKYQFKIFHPEVKNDEQIKQILLQRKQQNEQIKLIERNKKILYKLQFELKHYTKSQLLEKYPKFAELIEKLPDPTQQKTFQFNQKDQESSFNASQQIQSAITWESLNQLPLATDFLKDLMEEQEEDDFYLQEYQEKKYPLALKKNKIIKYNGNQDVQTYLNERQKRSVSEHQKIIKNYRYLEQNSIENLNNLEIQSKFIKLKTMNNPEQNNYENFISLRQLNSNLFKQKNLKQEKQQFQQQNCSLELPRQNKSKDYYHDMPPFKEKITHNKLNISMLKRVQQLSGLEAIKEQNLLNQIISQQREKQKIAQK
ncbi:unnamed protein product [Paramecium sonneborni]|uniref:Uncharacterized protein n=1 Tax=Paramecium sonneborni TaxID=65129 RepID=A0A8S1QUK3_9CILI|nr:unnamed protein product [Paramecium sonneborni]